MAEAGAGEGKNFFLLTFLWPWLAIEEGAGAAPILRISNFSFPLAVIPEPEVPDMFLVAEVWRPPVVGGEMLGPYPKLLLLLGAVVRRI